MKITTFQRAQQRPQRRARIAPCAAVALLLAAGAPNGANAADPCAATPNCRVDGPLMSQVVKVNVTDSGRVTAYHSVRTTLRIRNLGNQPVIVGYRVGSASLTDNQGHSYGWGRSGTSEARYVQGIGEVSRNGADPQFRLAPGEAREASFERILQYSKRNAVPGNVFSLDLTLAQLAVVGNRQVRTEREYALSFSNLTANSGLGAGVASYGSGPAPGPVLPGGGQYTDAPSGTNDAGQAIQAVGQMIQLFKGLGK